MQRPLESGQFRSRAFVRTLANNNLVGSMGRVGACGDCETRDDLRMAIVIWIEKTYHRRRRQRALGRLTPIEFELLHDQLATAA